MCEAFCTLCAIIILFQIAFGKLSISELIFGDLKNEIILLEKQKIEKEEFEEKMKNFVCLPLKYIDTLPKELQDKYWENEAKYRIWKQNKYF